MHQLLQKKKSNKKSPVVVDDPFRHQPSPREAPHRRPSNRLVDLTQLHRRGRDITRAKRLGKEI
jgi:hypothetical protein